MGMVYDVYFTLNFKEGKIKEAEAAARKFIFDKEATGRTSFSLDDYKKKGIVSDCMDNIMKIVITDRDFHKEGNEYSSHFEASYGWEGVMQDFFQVIAPFLEDESQCVIYPDSGCDTLIVHDGKAA